MNNFDMEIKFSCNDSIEKAMNELEIRHENCLFVELES